MAMFSRCAVAILLIVAVPNTAHAQLLSSSLLAPLASDIVNKLDPLTQREVGNLFGRSRVIVRAVDGVEPSALLPLLQAVGGTVYRTLAVVNAQAAEVPNAALLTLAGNSLVARISLDRPIAGAMERTSATTGATVAREVLGYDGSGVGVAIVDSGITSWHDDLTDNGLTQRVHRFVDLVNSRPVPYDDYGHGTHVTGIIAGNGFDSSGARSGIAPGVHLVVMKVLDDSGRGRISTAIAALDFVVAHRHVLNVHVVNMSIAAGVYESYNTDPLTLAARRVVESGVVVIAAAGNYGRTQDGRNTYGGITAPGNAPWVLTVGASSHSGTIDRGDDTIAAFSSRGPTAIDRTAKPDVVAPGVGIESLSDPASKFYRTKAAYLLSGTVNTSYLPYLSLSGTSMAAPVVSGTVALMLQANPALTPNQVKAILQYTAQNSARYNALTEGAGFVNAHGAVMLAAWMRNPSAPQPAIADWSRHLIWGTKMVSGGWLSASANAWPATVQWGAAATSSGDVIEWGDGWNLQNTDAENVVWGSACGGSDCEGSDGVGGANDDDSVVRGTSVVWGTNDDDSVVWGTDCSDAACEPVVWPNP
jgi:serine protease AprX